MMDRNIRRILDAVRRPVPEPTTPAPSGEKIVSIQIRDAANPDARKELRERLAGLVETGRKVWADEGASPDEVSAKHAKYVEEFKATMYALTGYPSTDDEIREVINL